MRIMVFRIGNLGDTVVALPAFNAIRRTFRSDEIILLTPLNKTGIANPAAVLSAAGLIDRTVEYDAEIQGFAKWVDLFLLRKKILSLRVDHFIYMPPSSRTTFQVQRDKLFFLTCGIGRLLGLDQFKVQPTRDLNGKILRMQNETDFLLDHLRRSCIPTDEAFTDLFSLLVTEREKKCVDAILPMNTERRYVAFCTGGKTPSQKWPLARYEALGRQLIEFYGICPVIFGGMSDKLEAEALLDAWGGGVNFCGFSDVREVAEGLRRCLLYIGNDTGPMHLAAFAGVPCLAIFSSRNNPGIWEPWGRDHTVIRKEVSCEGCELHACNVPNHPCLDRTTVEEVFWAAGKYLFSGERQAARALT